MEQPERKREQELAAPPEYDEDRAALDALKGKGIGKDKKGNGTPKGAVKGRKGQPPDGVGRETKMSQL